MTVPVIDVEIQVTPALVEFNRIAGRFTNFTPVLGGRIDVAVRKFLRDRFESEGRIGSHGGKWKKLSPRYSVEKRLAGFGGNRILQRSGDMMRAFTKRGDPHQVLRVGVDFYSLSVDEEIQPRARAHQFGIGVPRREIIPTPLPKTLISELRRIAKSYLVRGE